jgi:hypothetical protein
MVVLIQIVSLRYRQETMFVYLRISDGSFQKMVVVVVWKNISGQN